MVDSCANIKMERKEVEKREREQREGKSINAVAKRSAKNTKPATKRVVSARPQAPSRRRNRRRTRS